jgi:hypothetical protein
MIPKSGNRFSDKIMLKQKAKAKSRFDIKSFRFGVMSWQRPQCLAGRLTADPRTAPPRRGILHGA